MGKPTFDLCYSEEILGLHKGFEVFVRFWNV